MNQDPYQVLGVSPQDDEATIKKAYKKLALKHHPDRTGGDETKMKEITDDIIKSNTNSIKAVAMIRSYRQRGHLIAKLDPLGLLKTDYLEELHPESYGFKKEDYQKQIFLDPLAFHDYV